MNKKEKKKQKGLFLDLSAGLKVISQLKKILINETKLPFLIIAGNYYIGYS